MIREKKIGTQSFHISDYKSRGLNTKESCLMMIASKINCLKVRRNEYIVVIFLLLT